MARIAGRAGNDLLFFSSKVTNAYRRSNFSMAANARPLSLLLVEDNKDHVRIMTRVIGRVDSRIRVGHAKDTEAVRRSSEAAAGSHPTLPDIILPDLNMSKMNGLDLLKFIRHGSHLRHIPVIMLSGFDRPKEDHDACRFGANTFLSTSAMLRDFGATAQRLIEYWTAIALLPRFAEPIQ